MLAGLTHLLLFQCAGEALVHGLRLPFPGPVLGSLAAKSAIATGIIGAVLAKFTLDFAGVRNHAARGFAVGLAAHGIGTARAYQVSEVMGAFAGLALGLHGLVASFVLPPVLRLLGGAH
jgi:putative effector of murein hydrolase